MNKSTESPEKLLNPAQLSPLTGRHVQLLALVLAGDTPSTAYRQVYGCSHKTAMEGGSRVTKSNKFRLHLARAREELAASSTLSHSWILDKLKALVEECSEKGKGYNPGVATRALELLGKHLGTFEPKVRDLEDRPAFVGISINMGDKPSVEILQRLPSATTPAIDINPKAKDIRS